MTDALKAVSHTRNRRSLAAAIWPAAGRMTNFTLFAAAIFASTFPALPTQGRVPSRSQPGSEILSPWPPIRDRPTSREATGRSGRTKTAVDDPPRDHGHALPTLLSTVDPESGRLVNALNNSLYDMLLNPTTSFDTTLAESPRDYHADGSESGASRPKPSSKNRSTNTRFTSRATARQLDRPYDSSNTDVALTVDKRSISFHEQLTISWYVVDHEAPGGAGGIFQSGDAAEPVEDDDVIALYCPANEADPRKFRDALTVRQARYATASSLTDVAHFHGGGRTHVSSSSFFEDDADRSSRETAHHAPGDQWIIPSFPIVREESCEFRLWRLLRNSPTGVVAGESIGEISPTDVNGDFEAYSKRTRRANGEQPESNRFQLVSSSGPIDLERSMMKPTGVHLALTSNVHEMNVHFTTGDHRRGHQAGEIKIVPVVRYARHPAPEEYPLSEVDGGVSDPADDPEDAYVVIAGSTTTYKASDMCMSPANETGPGKFVSPGLLHVVTLTNLMPNTEYEYEPGVLLISSHDDPPAGGERGGRTVHREYSWSGKKNLFRSAPTVGSEHEPFHFLVYGDQGCPETGWAMGAKSVMKRLESEFSIPVRTDTNSLTLSSHSSLGAVHHFGDLSYAKGVAHIWDFWMHMVEPLSARVPLMVGVGNHEYDHTAGGQNGKDPSGIKTPGGFSPSFGNFLDDSGGECGVPVSHRFLMPDNGNGVFWYSYDYASTHVVMLSSEHDLSPNSRQYAWLRRDLENVNRTATPWLIVEIHRPLYNSFNLTAENKVGIGMREEFEPVLLEFGVDLVLAGHYHSYLRTCSGLYRGSCGSGGPTYITVGTAGAKLSVANIYNQTWTEAYFSEWGYGRVTVVNGTALHFEFVLDDANGTVKDDVWIKKN